METATTNARTENSSRGGAPVSAADALAEARGEKINQMGPPGAVDPVMSIEDDEGFQIISDGLERMYVAALPKNTCQGFVLRYEKNVKKQLEGENKSEKERTVEHLVVKLQKPCWVVRQGRSVTNGQQEEAPAGRIVFLGVRKQLENFIKLGKGEDLYAIKVTFTEQRPIKSKPGHKVWDLASGVKKIVGQKRPATAEEIIDGIGAPAALGAGAAGQLPANAAGVERAQLPATTSRDEADIEAVEGELVE